MELRVSKEQLQRFIEDLKDESSIARPAEGWNRENRILLAGVLRMANTRSGPFGRNVNPDNTSEEQLEAYRETLKAELEAAVLWCSCAASAVIDERFDKWSEAVHEVELGFDEDGEPRFGVIRGLLDDFEGWD